MVYLEISIYDVVAFHKLKLRLASKKREGSLGVIRYYFGAKLHVIVVICINTKR